jgi:plastocyanin
MKTGSIVGVIILLLILGGAIFFLNSDNSSSSSDDDTNEILTVDDNANENTNDNPPVNENQEENPPAMQQPKIYTIEMRDSGFSPSSLEINQGDTVNFVNIGTREIWPATNAHPTHTIYPSSNINKCGTAEENSIFDACESISPGESYSFTFEIKGTWSYHDHNRASMGGTIIVK